MDLLIEYESYNVWIDPIIPSTEIPIGPLCNNLYTLLNEMKSAHL